uniref:Uncharacterized protein n=1 Tax=Magallana gigas TaxID=29159 RepID=K1PQQ3_MAGGI
MFLVGSGDFEIGFSHLVDMICSHSKQSAAVLQERYESRLVVTAARAVVAVVAAGTFEVLVGTTGTATKIAIAATYQYKVVKFELNVQGDTVAFIEFDGRNSNFLNWFHNSRILNSSWTDSNIRTIMESFAVDTTNQKNIILIVIMWKVKESRYYRHFFINKNYGGCPRDLGWLAVKDSANFRGACGWDKHNSYPQFLYGRNGKVTRWNDMRFGKAEDLNIYVQMGY